MCVCVCVCIYDTQIREGRRSVALPTLDTLNGYHLDLI